jgi:hypothetical protein
MLPRTHFIGGTGKLGMGDESPSGNSRETSDFTMIKSIQPQSNESVELTAMGKLPHPTLLIQILSAGLVVAEIEVDAGEFEMECSEAVSSHWSRMGYHP